MDQKSSSSNLRKAYLNKIFPTLTIILFAVVILILLNQKLWSGTAIERYRGVQEYAEPQWAFKKGDTVLDAELKLPSFKQMEKGKTYSISTNISYDGSRDNNPFCFYFVDHMFTRVLLDDEVVFSYFPQDTHKRDHSKSPGNVYAAVSLPNDCRGKLLTIEFIPSLDADIEYRLPNPFYGNYYAVVYRMFLNDLPHNLIVILSIFLGLMFFLFSTLVLLGPSYREGLFISTFSVLFGLYNITESNFLFYVISNPYYTYVLDYMTFTLMPIFFIAFLRERMDEKRRRIVTGLIFVSLAMFIAEVTLHLTGIWDMREFLPVLHAMCFADFLIIFITMFTMKKKPPRRQFIWQIVPVMIGMMIDAAVYYKHLQLSTNDATFTALGIIIFLIAEIYRIWRYSVDIYTESIQSKQYREMAYVDALTGIGNRRAWETEKNAVMHGKKKNLKKMVVMSVDINNLKYINDTFGHAAGDFLIRSAANVLSDCTENYGAAFRVGGDEFMAFLYNIDQEKLKRRLKAMHNQIDFINQNSEIKLSLAVGYEMVGESSLEAAIANADKRMYKNKSKYKNKDLKAKTAAV